MIRRTLIALFALILATAGLTSVASAQDSTPIPGPEDLGLSILDVTVTDSGYEGIPDQLEAGRYLVNLTIEEGVGFGALAFVQPPEGVTADEFLAAAMAPPVDPQDGATPVLAEATPIAADPMALLFEATYAGGIASFDGAPKQVVVDLGPGEWIAWAEDPSAPQAPVVFEVTGDVPADLAEPESDVTLTMGEYVIEPTEGELASGSQLVEITNIGAQPHFIAMYQGPDDMTDEQVQAALDEENQAMMTGTPPAYSELDPNTDLMPVLLTGTQSTNTSIWVPLDLAPGTYVLLCFFPDQGDGQPHANHGMWTVIEVAD